MLLPSNQLVLPRGYNEFIDLSLFIKTLTFQDCQNILTYIVDNDLMELYPRMFYSLVCRLNLDVNSFTIVNPTFDLLIAGSMLGIREEFADYFTVDHITVILNHKDLLFNFNSLIAFYTLFNISAEKIKKAGLRIISELDHDYICDHCYKKWWKIIT